MNQNYVYYPAVVVLFSIVIFFIGITVLFAAVGFDHMQNTRPDFFDDTVVSFEFVHFALLLVAPLFFILFAFSSYVFSKMGCKSNE